jgi:hypothetical protein
LYRDDDAVNAYTDYVDGPLLSRSGGYWWDGATWYRPSRVIDWAGEDYYRRAVPAATTVTAAGILAAASGADPARGTVLDVAGIDPDIPYEGRWDDDLALWAAGLHPLQRHPRPLPVRLRAGGHRRRARPLLVVRARRAGHRCPRRTRRTGPRPPAAAGRRADLDAPPAKRRGVAAPQRDSARNLAGPGP